LHYFAEALNYGQVDNIAEIEGRSLCGSIYAAPFSGGRLLDLPVNSLSKEKSERPVTSESDAAANPRATTGIFERFSRSCRDADA
jgi:hypothetical protein